MPCASLLLIRETTASVMAERSRELEQDDSLFRGFGLPDDDQDGSRMDSIWELDLSAGGRSVFEENESAYSEESVLD